MNPRKQTLYLVLHAISLLVAMPPSEVITHLMACEKINQETAELVVFSALLRLAQAQTVAPPAPKTSLTLN